MSDQDSLELMMRSCLDDARSGDLAAAAMAAMLIHRYPAGAALAGIGSQYDWLLSQSLRSTDAELLACIGEELIKGKRLAANARLAWRFLAKANELSGFMGHYTLGRLAAKSKRNFAIKNLRRARLAGHIPSGILEANLVWKDVALIGPIIRHWYSVLHTVKALRAFKTKNARRLWRCGDVWSSNPRVMKEVGETIGNDRRFPFARLDEFLSVYEHARP